MFVQLIKILLKNVGTVASKKFWSSMLFQNLVRLSQMKKIPCPCQQNVKKEECVLKTARQK
jgi:hypothetical protein